MLSDSIKRLRETKKISLRTLAISSGVSKTTISEIENGVVVNPTLETIKKIAHGLGVSENTLLENDSQDSQTDEMELKIQSIKKEIEPYSNLIKLIKNNDIDIRIVENFVEGLIKIKNK